MTTPTSTARSHLDVDRVVPGGWSRRTRLRDGTRVLLRQIRPQDRDRLAAGLRELSAESRRLRFHAEVTALTDAQLTYLTEVDHLDHEAIVAIDLDRPGQPGIGVARYLRDPYLHEVAEVTVTVADRYHGQGAATLLLGALAARGQAAGVSVFRHHVLAHNAGMLAVLDRLGGSRELVADDRWCVDLSLPVRRSVRGGSPAGRRFLAVGRPRRRIGAMLGRLRRRRLDRLGRRPMAAVPVEVGADGSAAELTRWLADRDRRTVGWPTDEPTPAGPSSRGT